MLERVTSAVDEELSRQLGEEGHFDPVAMARSAIEPLRNPTPEMLATAWKVFRRTADASIQPGPAFKEALTAMINSILSDPSIPAMGKESVEK